MPRSPYPSSRVPGIRVLAAAALVCAGLVAVPAPASAAPTPPDVMVAMGDSITRAPLADGPTPGNGVNSWATGTTPSVVSHRTRLNMLSSRPVAAYNVAVSGSTSADLRRQAAQAVAYRAEYVTILSGANNVCKATGVAALPSVDEFRGDVAAALTTLAVGAPDAKILLLSVPSLQAVLDAGAASPAALNAWSVLGTCAIMLADPLSKTDAAVARRAAVETRIDEMNAAIEDVCAAFTACTYDSGAVHENHPALADLSPVDYFHPSLAGQARIAELTWAEVLANHLFTDPPVHTEPAAPQPAPAPETEPTPAPAPAPEAPQPPSTELPLPEPGTTKWTIDETSSKVTYSGTWRTTKATRDSGGSVAYTSTKGASFSLTFTGTRVSVLSRLTASAGISDVAIDGVPVGWINGYDPEGEHQATVFRSAELPLREHTITVTVSGSRDAASAGHNLILDALVVEVPQ